METYQTTRPISAAMASSIPAAAREGLRTVSLDMLVSHGYRRIIRNEDSRGVGTGLLHGVADAGENGTVKVGRTGLLGVGTTDDISACAV